MFRRTATASFVSLLAVLVLSSGTVFAQIDPAPTDSSPTSTALAYGDQELIAALVHADLGAAWSRETQTFTTQASLLRVAGSPAYDELRANFLADAALLGDLHHDYEQRRARLEALDADVFVLELALRQLFSGGEVKAEWVIAQTRQDRTRTLWLGFSFDILSSVEGRVAGLTDRLLDALTRDHSGDIPVVELEAVDEQLRGIRRLLERARQRVTSAQIAAAEAHAIATAQIPALVALRRTLPTEVNGLPMVTVDAYINGAASLATTCPVDWALLGGVGRIESRHGTLGGSEVLRSGDLTKDIFGPLLDGGATEREAEQARLEAEEEELRLELQAVEAKRVADEEAFEASVWGQLRREEAAAERVLDRPGASSEESQDGTGPSAVSDENNGDNNNDDDTSRLEDEEGEHDEPEFKGNGFAVIEDSDGGALDGNARWDRAVGPMQFIPETWSYWATDGNSDGVADPQNLYDAAATAGAFLCHLSERRGPAPDRFVLGYNSSDTYVRNVLSGAAALRVAALPTAADVSRSTGD